MWRTLQDLKENYEIDLKKVEKKIASANPKIVLLQFPDGLKPYSLAIKKYLQEKFPKVIFTIWLGSCFGACDIPPVEGKVDLVIQFGHGKWKN